MDILHAISSDRFAGVEQYVARLAQAQAAAGHRVQVLGGESRAMAHALGRSVAWLPARSARDVARGARRLSPRPDLINAHMTSAEIASLLGGFGTPVIATRHFAAPRGATRPRQFVLHGVDALLRAQIAVSHFVADSIGQPCPVVPGGVPTRPARTANPDRTVVVLGRLEAEKRADLALSIFHSSMLHQVGWKLVVAGSGSTRNRLESQAAQLHLTDSVTFLDHVDDPQTLLARSGILLAPCPVEAFGLAVVEAMAAGVPVVAVSAGGHRETVGAARPDLTYPPTDLSAAADLLRDLALAPDLARAAGAELRRYQRNHFTLHHQVSATQRVYDEALA